MLVLGRQVDGKIRLTDSMTGEIITIMICGVTSGGNVRIGIEAAQNWRIAREELLTGMQPRPAEVTR